MIRRALPTSLLILTALVAPAAAQSYEGLYDVVGTDATLGPYRGRVQLMNQGNHYTVVREVSYQTSTASGPLTTVWTGFAVTRGSELHLHLPLSRMGWITQVGALARTTADQAPEVVTGVYRPDPSGGLSGALTSTGGVSVTEALTRTGGAGSLPLYTDDRVTLPVHAPPPAWLKTVLFSIFRDYHTLPEIAPHTRRRAFQDAVHFEVRDRIGFSWLRAHPGELFLQNKRVDAISLAEADMRRSAYGLKLFEKAAGYDRDAEGRHLDDPGLLVFGVRPDPNVPGGLIKTEDMSAFLWSAVYLYSQSCRFTVTQDPQALTNVENMISVFCDMIEIDPVPGEFARSLRPVNRRPNTGRWHPGAGQFAQWAYSDNGNNDMIKGFWMAFIGAWDVLPQSSPLRARIVRCVRELTDSWAAANPGAAGGTGRGRDGPKNALLNNMLAFWITGDARYEAKYKRQLRKPMLLLELATGGTFGLYGIADWSGAHLGVVSNMAMVLLGRKLGSPWVPAFEHALRQGYRFMHTYRQTVWSVAAAALLNKASAADEALWQLREFPYPKRSHTIDRNLDPTWTFSPYPGLPWKMDWMTNPGRKSGLFTYPVFMRSADNYFFRSGPFDRGGRASSFEHPGGDFLFAYWVARRYGVVSASE